MTTTRLKTLAVAALGALALAACDDRTDRTVGQKLDSALERTQQKLASAPDKIAQQTDRAATNLKEKTTAAANNVQTEGSSKPMSDTAITASIKTDFLKDPDLSVLKIDVDTRDGVVVLNGLAENDEARARAERIAQGIKGVREVKNYLVTKRV